jgi:cell division protein FtsW
MMNNQLKIDKYFLISVALLAFGGFFIFASASLGLLARDSSIFQSVALKQMINLILGITAFIIMSKIHYKNLKKYAFYIFLSSIILNLFIFIPGLALDHGGAMRWIDLGFITFQPSEFLKIAFIIYFSAWLSSKKEGINDFKSGPLAYMVIMIFLGILFFFQKDTDTFVVIAGTGFILLFIAGARIRHLAIMSVILISFIGVYVATHYYALQRVITFLNRGSDVQGSGYQIQQSLIAIGSGQIAGRGFGQSIQKFSYLPEPIGDSIFAVSAEEFGFIGSLILVFLYVFFLIRSVKVSFRSPDAFSRLIVMGIAILIVIESFMNISSMLGIIPLSGMPLLFVSHGGTALIIILGATGIIANISKYKIQN